MKYNKTQLMVVVALSIGIIVGIMAFGGVVGEVNAQPEPIDPEATPVQEWVQDAQSEYSGEDYYENRVVVGDTAVYSTAHYWNGSYWNAYLYKLDGDTGEVEYKKHLWTKGGNGKVVRLIFSAGQLYVFEQSNGHDVNAGYLHVFDPSGSKLWDKDLLGEYPVRAADMYDVDDGYFAVLHYMDTSDPSPLRFYDPQGNLIWETITNRRYAHFTLEKIMNMDMEKGLIYFKHGPDSPTVVGYDTNGNFIGNVTANTDSSRHYPRITAEGNAVIGDTDGYYYVGLHLLDVENETQLAERSEFMTPPTNWGGHSYWITDIETFPETIIITTSYSEAAGLDSETLATKWMHTGLRNEAWTPSLGASYLDGYLADIDGKAVYYEPSSGNYTITSINERVHDGTFANGAPLFYNTTAVMTYSGLTVPADKCINLFCLLDNPLIFIGLAVLAIMIIALAGRSMAIAAWSGYLMFSYLALQTALTQNLINTVYATLVLMLMGIGFKLWRLEGGGES